MSSQKLPSISRWLFGCLILALLAFLVGGGIALLANLVPTVAQQLPPNAMPLVVTLTTPPNASVVPLNQITNISAEAIGAQPITALELWVDGARWQTKNAPAGSALAQLSAFWTWTPTGEGEHVLVVRATDAEQRVSESNVVRVTAAKSPPTIVQMPYPVKPGDTVASVAQKQKITPQEIVALNPQLNPNNPLAPGETISVPVTIPTPGPAAPVAEQTPVAPEPTPTPPSDPPQPPPGNPNPLKFIFAKYLFGALNPPKAPTIWWNAKGCTANLLVQDKASNEDGFFIYRLDPGNLFFARVATLDAHSQPQPFQYTDPNLSSGEWYYYVAAFNTKGESPSNQVKVKIVGPACDAAAPKGPQLGKGKLSVSEKVDKVYCYLSINGASWNRIPPAPNTFITPDKNGEFDVSPYLNALPPGLVTIELECWAWKGDTLVYLGKTKQTINGDQEGPVVLPGDKFKLAGVMAVKAMGGGYPPSNYWLNSPFNFASTGDPKKCAEHLPGLLVILLGPLCQEAIKDGYAVLVWQWAEGFCGIPDCVNVGEPDGYRIYRMNSLVKEVDSSELTVVMFPWPSSQYTNCYRVRAFKKTLEGVIESEDSNYFCLKEKGGSTGVKITTIKPGDSMWRSASVYVQDNWQCGTKAPPPEGPGPIAAGYRWEFMTNCFDYYDTVYRGAVWFDVAGIPPPIVEARLNYNTTHIYCPPVYGGPENVSKNVDMGTNLMLGTADWKGNPWGNQFLPMVIPAEDYLQMGPAPNWSYSVDVTSLVKEWMQGTRPNYGFVFRGNDESFPTDEGVNIGGEYACYSKYGNFTLAVTHFNP